MSFAYGSLLDLYKKKLQYTVVGDCMFGDYKVLLVGYYYKIIPLISFNFT